MSKKTLIMLDYWCTAGSIPSMSTFFVGGMKLRRRRMPFQYLNVKPTPESSIIMKMLTRPKIDSLDHWDSVGGVLLGDVSMSDQLMNFPVR
jgi:hypothetical protein